MNKPKLAVVQFPGSNCEYETKSAADYFGFDSAIIRWNDIDALTGAHAVILPGGFSYQDRVRSGAIAAKLPIVERINTMANAGTPLLGICNGCQILAEAGLIVALTPGYVDVGMAPNSYNSEPAGYICDWKYVVATNPKASIFTQYYTVNDVLPVPIAHGEGRFVISDRVTQHFSDVAAFQYCTPTGEVIDTFPVNPNGSMKSIAAISNPAGNVMGIMPHPERAAYLRQIPVSISGGWALEKHRLLQGGTDQAGPWEKLFIGMRDAAKDRR